VYERVTPRSAVTGEVDLDVGQVDFALLLQRGGGVVNLLPVAAAVLVPVGVFLHLPLAGDAQGGVGQGVEPPDGDLVAAALAQAVGALLEAGQGPVDLAEFAGVQFGQLGGHLVAAGLKGGVGRVAAGVGVLEVPQAIQFVCQLAPDVGPAVEQGFVQA